MRFANIKGRASLIVNESRAIDIEEASAGQFPADPQRIYRNWDALLAWARTAAATAPWFTFAAEDLENPVPSPSQVLAIGLNYRAHAEESGFAIPTSPTVFTKFPSSLAGPNAVVTLPADGHTDWEVELVAVIGKEASNVPEVDAWKYVAGLTVGQDISERITQAAGPAPQFSLGKSFANFGPLGPWVVTPDEFENPDDLELGCSINGQEMQKSRTSDLVFSVPELIAQLSAVLTLKPGDVIFTGTPAGVGLGRKPQVWLQPGDELLSWITGLGSIRQVMVGS
ncbi:MULTISPECIES: fumarylacetoacetate hydrolase family protein [unclassified Pseudarthrobacter]|uniref:fumarylacetoacetate hydrolase family protein n=1 Tax=unclassified Pseudarthrobacter TaxID=2647000 RepID=UPI003076A4D1